jgi:serine/threonine-protein kinase RsbW
VIASGALTIPSRTTAIDEARRWVTAHLAPAGADPESIWALEMALTEALANVIEHSYGGDESQRIDLLLEVHDDRVELVIRDFGEPFDERAYRPPDLDAAPAGGYGVHLVNELMDDVERLEHEGRGTRLRLVKRDWKGAQ